MYSCAIDSGRVHLQEVQITSSGFKYKIDKWTEYIEENDLMNIMNIMTCLKERAKPNHKPNVRLRLRLRLRVRLRQLIIIGP